MEQMVLNEQEMREYVESEVRKSLMENIDEGPILDRIMGILNGNSGAGIIGKYIKEHMNLPDLINFAIGIFGVTPIVKYLCGALGLEINGPLGKLLITALSTMGTVAVGDALQKRRAAAGGGGSTSEVGGAGASGGGASGGR